MRIRRSKQVVRCQPFDHVRPLPPPHKRPVTPWLGRLSRIDEPANPLLAFREAIANENCHRDYASGGSAIGVAIYDDRLEVTSSGTLHFGCTPPRLFDRHESQPRPWNSLIAIVYYRCCIIETWRQGPLSMAAWSKEAELPKPEIVEIPGEVVVRSGIPDHGGHGHFHNSAHLREMLGASARPSWLRRHRMARVGGVMEVVSSEMDE